MFKLNHYIKLLIASKNFLTLFILLLFSINASAQLVNVPVTGFNNDLVANGGGASGTPNTGVSYPAIGFDGAGYSLVSQGYLAGASTPTCFMPTNNLVPSLLTPGLTYSLQGYGTSAVNSNNALTLNSPSATYVSPFPTTSSLTLTTPSSYAKIYFLVGSVVNNLTNTMNVTVTFTDATTQTFSSGSFPNWFSGSAATTAFYQFNRVNPNNTALLNVCTSGTYTSQPSMFEYSVSLAPANFTKLVSSITFTSTSTSAAGTTSDKVNYLHILSVGGTAPCTGTPTPGNTISSANPTCPSINFTLSTQNATGGGATFQWQSSPDGSTWTNIASATNATLSIAQSAPTYYQCVVTCPTGPNTAISNPVFVTMNAPSSCYCINTNLGTATHYISSFSTTNGNTNITNNGTGFSPQGYGNYTAMSASQLQGSTVNFSMTETGGTMGFGLWIDWNQNGSFADAGEQLYLPGVYQLTGTGSFTVPLSALPGSTRMRIVGNYLAQSPTACTGSLNNTECEDYTFTVIQLFPCVTPLAQPTAPILTAYSTSQINGSYTAATGSPSGYLVVRYPAGASETVPVNGTVYASNQALGLGTVIQSSISTSFISPGLSIGTSYDYYVYSYNNLCLGTPYYLTSGGFIGTISTNSCSSLSGIIPVGPTAPPSPAGFPTLNGAGGALTYIIANGLGGPTILELQPDFVSATEILPFAFNANSCLNNTTPLTIRPAGTVGSPFTFTTSNTTAALIFDGASYITFDGRNGGTGTNKYIRIINTASTAGAAGNAVLLRNESNNILLNYLDLQASNLNPASNVGTIVAGAIPGVVAIGSTTGANGNDNNTISNCDIHSATTSGNLLNVGIYAYNGTAVASIANNDNNTITGNNIYDCFNAGSATAAIDILAGNNAYTITNNNFYKSAATSFVYTGGFTHRGFWITPGASTTGLSAFVISGNFIGGTSAGCGGTAYTMSGAVATAWFGMDISVGTLSPSNIFSNTIQNINYTTTSNSNPYFAGIQVVGGNVNVGLGAGTGNTIGSGTGNGSITITNNTTSSTSAFAYGIRMGGGLIINTNYNTVGSFTINNGIVSNSFAGITIGGGGSTSSTVNNNLVGSLTTPNSIQTTGVGAPATAMGMAGIYNNFGPTSCTVNNNIIRNLYSSYTGTNVLTSFGLRGIDVAAGINTITGNEVTNLASASTANGSGFSSAICGIVLRTVSVPFNVSGNTVHTLKLTNAATTSSAQIIGIFMGGGNGAANVVSGNNIHSLSLTALNNTVTITGITVSSGQANYSNNMIRLGYDETGASVTAGVQFRGITKGIAVANNFYHNSIYIGGTNVVSSTLNSFAFQRSIAPTALPNDEVLNNIFVNNRSNAAGTSKHYVFSASANAFLTTNFNDYYYNGTGGVFGLNLTTDVANYTAGWIAGDVSSQTGDPQYINPTGTAVTGDLHINTVNQTVIEQNGTTVAAITTDYDGQTRATLSPIDIGADAGNFAGYFCSDGPLSATANINNATPACGIASRIFSLTGFTPLPGYTYQWQESATGLAGSFVNVTTGTGGTAQVYTNTSITATTYYQCVIVCAYGGLPTTSSSVQAIILPAPLTITPASGSNVCSGANVDLSATGADTYSWTCVPGPTNYPSVTLFTTVPTNFATITSRPTSTLASNVAFPPATTATPTWTYTVNATYLNGCTRQSTVVLNVINSPVVPVVLTTSNSPDPVCAPGTPVTLTVNNNGNVGGGQWIYNWYDQTGTTLLQTATNSAASSSYTPPAAVVNGNNIYTAKVSNTLCPASYGVASPMHFVGYTSQKVTTNANCGDNGTLKVFPEGQNSFTNWYSNSFATGLSGPVNDASFGSTNFTSGSCMITSGAPNINGTFLVKNPLAINTNNLQMDFKLNTSIRGMYTGTTPGVLGADGICWSYAADVTQGLVSTGGQAEGGSGSGLKIAFDATANTTANTPGIYLMYNCNVPGPGASSPGVIAYKWGSYWQGLTDAPVSITISEGGLLTMKFNNEIIFDHVQLPAEYLTADKSTWLHAFTARSGAAGETHAIDDLSIRYNSYEYSINSTNGANGTWQSSNSYTGLASASYPVWVRNPADPTCVSNTGNALIGISPSPSSALTVAAAGYKTTICAGNSTNLTTDVSVPGAVFLWESSSNIGGPYAAASGINNAGVYTTGPLTANTYYRCTFTCPSSTPTTSTPVLVSVNIGSIASTNSPQTANCSGTPVTLSATPGPNTSCVWYSVPVGGSALFTGNSFSVTPATLPSTYYIEPVTTIFTDHFDFGGEKTVGNLLGSTTSGVNISTKFSASASIRIDSIKVFAGAAGTLTVALQKADSSANIVTYSMAIAAADVNKFVNVPVNFTTSGSGNFQITTTGINCQYYNSYTGSYAVPYMSMGGVMSIIGGSTTPTGANNINMYGTAFNWSITSSCPVGFGARVPVLVNSNPAYLVSVTPASTVGLCANAIQELTASSPNSYSSYTWSPIANLYADAAATIPVTAGTNQATVYFKSAAAGTFNPIVSTIGSGCTNTATASVSTIAAPNASASATPASVCAGGNVQLNAVVTTAVPYCTATGGTGTYYMNNFSTAGGVTNITNNNSGFSPSGYGNFTAMSVTQAVGSSVSFSVSNFSTGTYGVAVFVDWNQNGVLNEAGEQVYASGASYVSSAAGSFTVPAGAYNGNTRMRVVVDFLNTAPGACDVATSHETEDYSFTVTGGINNNTGVYTYDWSANPNYLSNTGISNPVATSIQTNEVYSVTVTNPSTGCFKVVPVNVTALPLPVPSASSNSPVCENGDVFFTAYDGAQYSWSGPNGFSASGTIGDATLPGAEVTDAGNYTVQVTGANGCTSSETIYVQVNDNPEPFLASMGQVTCDGFNDGSFQVGVSGGTPFFTFTEGSQGQNFSGFFGGLTDGTYYVVVTDLAQCISVQPLEVVVATVPNLAPVISCPSNISTTNTPGSCGAIVSYTTPVGTDVCPVQGTLRTNGLASGSTFPIGTTTNTFVVTDASGLTATCSFNVTVTDSELPTVVNCPSNFSSCNPISWIPPTITDNCLGLQIISSHTPGTNFGPGNTLVTYTATDAYNNVSTCSFTVTRLEQSDAPTGITTNRDFNNICSGENITLTVDGGTLGAGANWRWYTGSCAGTLLPAFNGMSSITVSPTATTTYFVRADGQCNITACASVQVVVSTNAPGSVVITSVPAVGAPGVTGTVTCTPVAGATFYRWTSNLGHINAIWFNGAPGPVETSSNSVNVAFQLAQQNYQIRVVAGNACGRSNNASAHIRGSVEAPSCLVGPAVACPLQTATYSVATCPVGGTNGYLWTVTGNATILSGQGTTSISVQFGAGFTSAQVCVSGVSQFGLAGPQTCLNVSNNTAAPGTISGNNLPCSSSVEGYSIAPVANALSYVWSTNIVGAVASGTTVNGSVSFPLGSFSGQVCVQAVSGCGTSVATCYNVSSGVAGVPGPISGPTAGICGASNVNYALATNDANSYNWILPSGVTLVGAGNANSVNVNFATGLTGPIVITVEAFYNCGSNTSTITVDGSPAVPTVTPATICAGSDALYFASSAGADQFNWTLTGADYEECTNLNCSQYYVIWSANGGTLEVTATNSCGTSAPFSMGTNCRITASGSMDTKVYPNPTDGNLTILFNSYAGGNYELSVTDMTGRTVLAQDVKATSGLNEHKIDLGSANPGMYMLYLKDAKGDISVNKITVE